MVEVEAVEVVSAEFAIGLSRAKDVVGRRYK